MVNCVCCDVSSCTAFRSRLCVCTFWCIASIPLEQCVWKLSHNKWIVRPVYCRNALAFQIDRCVSGTLHFLACNFLSIGASWVDDCDAKTGNSRKPKKTEHRTCINASRQLLDETSTYTNDSVRRCNISVIHLAHFAREYCSCWMCFEYCFFHVLFCKFRALDRAAKIRWWSEERSSIKNNNNNSKNLSREKVRNESLTSRVVYRGNVYVQMIHDFNDSFHLTFNIS